MYAVDCNPDNKIYYMYLLVKFSISFLKIYIVGNH